MISNEFKYYKSLDYIEVLENLNGDRFLGVYGQCHDGISRYSNVSVSIFEQDFKINIADTPLAEYFNVNEEVFPDIEMIKVNDYFSIGKYPVTQQQWKAVMGNNPSYFKEDDHPVESVSYNDVLEFITKLNKLTNRDYRLPTHKEWFTAANVDNTIYSGSNNLDEVAWWYKNSEFTTHPVGLKKPNSLGIYDMNGNVWEWCKDCILRGGSWNDITQVNRVASRYRFNPVVQSNSNGFRLAQDN